MGRAPAARVPWFLERVCDEPENAADLAQKTALDLNDSAVPHSADVLQH